MITAMGSVHPGERFGRLVVIEEREPGPKSRMVAVRCDCGGEKVVRRDKLRGGLRSCGCLIENHGHTPGGVKSPTYRAWNGLMTRAAYVGSREYRYHGAMGVEVCMRWRRSFVAFLADMGVKPDWADGGIDRIDPWGHYSCGRCQECATNGWPANCRWSTRSQQSRNRRKAT